MNVLLIVAFFNFFRRRVEQCMQTFHFIGLDSSSFLPPPLFHESLRKLFAYLWTMLMSISIFHFIFWEHYLKINWKWVNFRFHFYGSTSFYIFYNLFYRVFGTAIAVSAFLNMLLPGAAKVHPAMVIIVRILQGLVEVFIWNNSTSSLYQCIAFGWLKYNQIQYNAYFMVFEANFL